MEIISLSLSLVIPLGAAELLAMDTLSDSNMTSDRVLPQKAELKIQTPIFFFFLEKGSMI